MPAPKIQVHARWMIRRDAAEVLAIDEASFGPGWTEGQLLARLRQRDMIGQVAEVADRVVGYAIKRLIPGGVRLWSMAVHPDYRRCGVGSALLASIVRKLHQDNRPLLTLHVRQQARESVLFFQNRGLEIVDELDAYEPMDYAAAFRMEMKAGKKGEGR